MEKDKDGAKFTIEGNPGTGNTFISIGTAYNVNPNATEVHNTFNIGTREEGEKVVAEATGAKPGDKKLGNMTLRDMLKGDYIDTGNIQPLIMNYVSCIRPYVKDEMDKLYMHLWAVILDHEAFKVDLYDPGKQDCKFNRNLVANIMHYLDGKGFYKKPYNQSEMTRAVESDADNPVRKGFREYPDEKYCQVVEEIIKEYQEK